MRAILAAVIVLLMPAISRGQQIATFQILHTQRTDHLALFEVAEPNYGEVVCGAHTAGRTVLWTSCYGPFASPIPYRKHYCGVTVSLLAADGIILVANCEKQRSWWGRDRGCRVPSGPQITAELSGSPFFSRAKLRWFDTSGRRREEMFRLVGT